MEKRLDEILLAAITLGVTDIHFSKSNQSEQIVIEMRNGNMMRKLKPKECDVALFRYLMYSANLDVSNAFLPQTGRLERTVGGMHLSLRFAVVTSYHVTSGVLRILNNHTQLTIEQLTPQKDVVAWLNQITKHRTGLYLLSGPTSSGKTTSLYTILNQTENKKIFTLEDPIEVVNERYVQLQVNEAQHLSYAEGIKQLMRHDPDIIMIGEIRDEIAAQMCVRCALTGHLVLSTVHSMDCASAIIRMRDLGVKEYELKDVLKGVSNQRLYELDDNRRMGIYEFMDEKEVSYYLQHRRTTENFQNLSKQIQHCIEENFITEKQVQKDLF